MDYEDFLKWYRVPKGQRESPKRFCALYGVSHDGYTKWKRRADSEAKETQELKQELGKEQVKSGTYDAVEHLKKNLPAVTQALIDAAINKLNPNAIKLVFEITGNYKSKGEGEGEIDGVKLSRLLLKALDELEIDKEQRKSIPRQSNGNGSSVGKTPNTLPGTTS